MNPPGYAQKSAAIPEQPWMRRLRESEQDTVRGFRVEAIDGEAGRVEQVLYWNHTDAPDFIIVGSGRWFFGRKAVLPVRDIEDIDIDSKLVRMNLSREEIRNAPEFLPLS
jgi:hypothetical protein